MSIVTIGTLEATRRLCKAGFDEKQAETIVRILILSDAQRRLTREYLDFGLEAFERRLTISFGVMLVVTAGVIIAALRPDLFFTIP